MGEQKNELILQMIANLKIAIEEAQKQQGTENRKVLNSLFDALETEGILIDTEQEAKKALLARIDYLEKEVEMIKELVARSLKANTDKVLKG